MKYSKIPLNIRTFNLSEPPEKEATLSTTIHSTDIHREHDSENLSFS